MKRIWTQLWSLSPFGLILYQLATNKKIAFQDHLTCRGCYLNGIYTKSVTCSKGPKVPFAVTGHKWWYFLKITGAVSQTTESILGMFVLVLNWMHFSCWIQIWLSKFAFWKVSNMTKELKGGIMSPFDPCVNAMWRQPYWLSCMNGGELLYLRIRRHYSRWSAHIIVTTWITAQYSLCERYLSPPGKGNSHLLGGLSYEKIWWPPQQIPLLNFLEYDLSSALDIRVERVTATVRCLGHGICKI